MGVADTLWGAFGVGAAICGTLIALPIAILIALALVRLFRWRVARSMAAAAGVPQDPAPRPGDGSSGTLDIALIDAAPVDERLVPALADARRQARELAAIHAEAACFYPVVFAFLWWNPSDAGILRAGAVFGLFSLVLGTPVVFAAMMILCKRPRLLALAAGALVAVLVAVDSATAAESRLVLYVGAAVPVIAALMLMMLRREPRLVIVATLAIVVVLLAAGLFSEPGSRPGTDFVGAWLMVAAAPAAVVVVLNTRRLRAVGPVVFVGMLLLLSGMVAGAAYASLVFANAVDARFVREDLAQLPFFEAMVALPLPDILATVRAMVSEPASVYRYDAEKRTLWVDLLVYGLPVAGAALGAGAGWAAVRWLAGAYKRRRASEQMLSVAVMMLIFVVPMSVLFAVLPEGQGQSRGHGWLAGAIGLASFAGYKVWMRVRLRFWLRRQPPARPRTLLLLRVFGFDRRTQRLLEDVSQRWRYLGPIRLIGGPDLASATLEPHEFFDFLNGRLSRAFVTSRKDLEGRLADGLIVPDPDGLYRVYDFFCHDDTWRMTVSRLAQDSDAILMDLRGFTAANRGCIFEIEHLIAGVPLDRVVLLVDASTDIRFLIATVQEAFRAMPGEARNAGAGPHRVRILKASSRHRRTLRALLGLLCHQFAEAAVDCRAPSAPREEGVRPEAAA